MEDILKTHTEDDIYREDPVAETAYENFGIRYLFPWQRLVVANILEAYECFKLVQGMSEEEKRLFDAENSDSFCKGRQIVLLPTGAGKSLCFQVPALLLDGLTLVIYPLLALMMDQQRRMEEGALTSVIFRGGQSEQERELNFRRIADGAKIIIANPEVLKNRRLLEQLKQCGIVHVAIDEAHTTSEWGDTFRPAYLDLGEVLSFLNPPIVTAFTATASPQVLSRISDILFNGEAHIVRSESDRKNIHYFVRQCSVKKKEALYLAATQQRPMIIFCGTRNKAEDMCRELNACFGDEFSRFYHAGLERDEKETIEKWFFDSKDGVLCATCAYGMGVDKKDIKTVVHIEASPTAEAYIQEAGRGGRDGSVAKAILLWSLEDSLTYSKYASGSREAAMRDFAETDDCRRQVLLDALGAEQAVCSGCDLCNYREQKKLAVQLKGRKKKNYLAVLEKSGFTGDWKMAYGLIKKKNKYLNRDTFSEEMFNLMNDIYKKAFGLKIWNHSDSVEVLNQLSHYGFVQECNLLWKNNLKINKKSGNVFIQSIT